ncbi:MAG: response regulator [Deltaproteobacteria bacterium]|nr:response regulator [Deltaproteobacteria bacterium]
MGRGDELLVIDGSATDRDGLKKLFAEDGFIVSAVADTRSARELIIAKFFPVVLVDADVEPDSTLDIVRIVRERSAQSTVIVLTNRKVFDLAVEAFRLGVADVIHKRPDQVPYLRERALAAADRYRLTSPDGGGALIREVQGVLGEALERLMSLARQVPATASVLAEADELSSTVLLIDDDIRFIELAARAAGLRGLEVIGSTSGGAGLDQATTTRFDIVAAKGPLPDLPGAMVVRSLQSVNRDVAALVYEGPGSGGHIDVFEGGRARDTTPFRKLDDLVESLVTASDQAQATRRERRFLQAFRSQEATFLKRYAELKRRIDKMAK